jgi:membrane protease YdiL (CAAX protease family)
MGAGHCARRDGNGVALVGSLMPALAPDVLGVRPANVDSRGRLATPARLLSDALFCQVAAVAAGFAVALILAIGFHHKAAWTGQAHAWNRAPAVVELTASFITGLVVLLAARTRARIVGGGNTAAGLGDGPITRPRLLVAFAIIGAVLNFSLAGLLDVWLKPDDRDAIAVLFEQAWAAGPFFQAMALLYAVGLGPLSEEWFFRGWLWTGMRRHWRPLPVMVATALPWVLLHMFDSPVHAVGVIPAAIVLSLARQYCGGVRASLVLHVLTNLSLVTLAIVMRLAGHP